MAGDRIVVLGAGVAGLAAARRLALLNFAPLLIAPQHPIASRGETLSAKALPFLEGLGWSGLLDEETSLEGQERFSVWGSPALRRNPLSESPGFHIDRSAFEQKMADALGHVDSIGQAAMRLEHMAHGIRLQLEDGRTIEASALVDCTGRAAFTSGASANRRRTDKLTAVWQMFDVPVDAEIMAATLIEAVEIGWWYVSPTPGRKLMAGLFTDSDLLPARLSRDAAAWRDLVLRTEVTRARLESFGLLEVAPMRPPEVAPAATITVSHLVEGRIIRAGDAAAALDPLAANGLTAALWSGIAAADAAIELGSGDTGPARAYERSFLEGIASQLAGQRALYRAERRFAQSPFWSRRQR